MKMYENKNLKRDAFNKVTRETRATAGMDIRWTPTGKIAKINQNKKKIILTFAYDPMGNRVTKTVTDMTGKKKPFTTYYTRDAQGNTMAVYDNHFYKNMMKICTTYREDVLEAMDRIKEWELQCIGNGDPQCIQSQYESYQQLLAKKDSCKYKVQAYVYGQSQTLPCDLEPQYIDLLELLYNQDHDSYTQLDAGGQVDYMTTKEQEYAPQLNDAMACFMKQLRYIMSMDIAQRDEYINAYRGGMIQEQTSHTLFNTLNELQLTCGGIIDTSYTDSLYWKEQHLYGSSRLGMAKPNIEVTNYRRSTITAQTSNYRNYELTNHLGNVLATIKDEKKQVSLNGTTVDYYEPIVMTATDYYPFGMPMPNRSFTLAPSEGYRFGFNGQEKESDIYGDGNAYDFGDRVHDTRTGRFLSLDPLSVKYPMHSNYSYSANNPIYFIEVQGRYFTGSVDKLNTHIAKLKQSNSAEAKAELANIQRMQNSDIEFNIQPAKISTDIFSKEKGVTEGHAMWDFENNRMNINFNEESEATLSHELEHGRQFMDGEIDYLRTAEGESTAGPSYDKTDEHKAFKVQQKFEDKENKMSDEKIKEYVDKVENYKKLNNNPLSTSPENTRIEVENTEMWKVGKEEYKSTYNYTPNDKQKKDKIEKKERVKF